MIHAKTQVGFVAGYRVSKKIGGTYGNILGQLRTAGLLDYPNPGTVTLTDAGLAQSQDPGIGYGNDAMQAAVMDKLAGPEQRVLENLIQRWPDPISKLELAELSGYQVSGKVGGTYGNILGRLRSLGLIDYPTQGQAVATGVLFPEQLAA